MLEKISLKNLWFILNITPLLPHTQSHEKCHLLAFREPGLHPLPHHKPCLIGFRDRPLKSPCASSFLNPF